MKRLSSLIILCFFFSCKKENNTQIKEIEILRYERALTDTILPEFYICVNSSGKVMAVTELQKNKLTYFIFKLNQMPIDQTFKYEKGTWKKDLPSIQGSAYCLNVIYKNNSSKVIYIDDDKIYPNSSLLKFLENVKPQNNLNRKISSDTFTLLNSKMKRFVNFVVQNDSSIMRSPPPPKLY